MSFIIRRTTFRSNSNRLALPASLLALLLILVAAPQMVTAQDTTGATLRGTVKDQKGSVIPGAVVTLKSTGTGDERQSKTNDNGAFVFTAVASGTYTLSTEADGFKTSTQSNLRIAPSENRSADVELEIGTKTEIVNVNAADQVPIKIDTGERSDTITAAQIDNLSIIGRSSLELLRILPGVVAPDPGDPNAGIDRVTFGGGANATANYTVNGIRGVNNSVTIDGSRVIDIGANNGTIITPNNDMVQEVTVKSSNYAAEYGSSGVHISATTKSGSKDFHGEVYDYLRPEKLQANDRSSTIRLTPRPHTSFQYPGGNVGGPIILPGGINKNRDKLFFFVGFEVQRQRPDRGSRVGTVPTAKERAGDFSQSRALNTGQYGTHLCPPDTIGWSDCNGSGGLGADGGARSPVPGSNFVPYKDPLGSALLNFYPLPNYVPVPGSGDALQFRNYASAFVSPENRTDLKMRYDWRVTNSTNLYVRLARESESDDNPYGIWWGPSAFELPSHLVGGNLGRSLAANVTTVLSPTMTNEFVFSASKLRLDYDFSDPSKVSKAALGVANLKLPWDATGRANTPYAPLQLISWEANSANMWEPGGVPLFAINDSYSITETLSKVYNNHTFKFGGLIERATKVQNSQSDVEGRFEFEASQGRTTGNAFANLYTGRINSVLQSTNVPIGHFKLWNIEGYGQDSWRVKPNVTVEFGARINFFPNNTETTGLATVFDPTAYNRNVGAYFLNAQGQPDLTRPNGFKTFARGEIPKGVFGSNPPPYITPRLNVAWDVFKDGTTVLRGGAGLFYNRVQGNYQYAVATLAPNKESFGADSWGTANNDISISNLAQYNPLTSNPGPTCHCVDAGTSQDRNSNQVPRIATTSLSLARRLPFQNVLEVAYVGTFGRHLPQRVGLNFILNPRTSGTLGNANMADPVQRAAVANNTAFFFAQLPFPVYSGNGGGVTMEEFNGISAYHSMQLTLNRSLGKRFQYFLTYTFSKALGTTSVNESDGDQIVDPLDARGKSFGILPYDRTHIFNFSYNYTLPNLAKGSFSNVLTRGLFNGWQMSGITTLQSGRPIRVKFVGAATGDRVLFSWFGNNAVAGGNALGASGIAPIVLRNAVTGNTNVGAAYLDASAFAMPAFGTNGPAQSPFILRAPSTNNWDVTFFKNFKTSDYEAAIQIRLFNAFNNAFANPDLSDIGGLSGGSLNLNTIAKFDPQFDLTDSGGSRRPGTSTTCFQIPIGTPNGNGNVVAAGNPIFSWTAGAAVPVSGVCDPTKGFNIDPSSAAGFGKIVAKHGHRRIELAVKFQF